MSVDYREKMRLLAEKRKQRFQDLDSFISTETTMPLKGSTNTNETTRLLQKSIQISNETEDISYDINDDLNLQEEKLNESIKHIHSVSDIIQVSKDYMNIMYYKAINKKLWLWSIIAILFLSILLVLIIMILNDGKLYLHRS